MTGGHSFLGIFDRGVIKMGVSPIPAKPVVFFSIFRPHLNSACATFRVKRVNLHLQNDVRQIHIYQRVGRLSM